MKTMKGIQQQIVIAFLCAIIPLSICSAEDAGWKTATTDNGRTVAKSRVSERETEKGEKVPLVEYTVTTTEKASFEKCVSLMQDVANHKAIMDTKSAELINTISDNEWVVYYYYKGMGPVADSDSVLTMSFSKGPDDKTAIFTLSAAPSLYKQLNIKRTTFFNQTYTFKDLGTGDVEIAFTSSSSPAMTVPAWMIKSAFPGVAFDAMHRFVKLAKS